MKKVLIFHHCGDIGGAGISLLNTVYMLKDEFEVIVYAEEGPIVEKFMENDLHIKTYKKPFGAISSYSGSPKILSRTYLTKLSQILNSKQEIDAIIKEENPQIVITNSVTTAYVASVVKHKYRNIRVVSFIRETYRLNIGTKINIRYLSKYADCVLYISKNDLNQYNISGVRQEVIYNSINLSFETKSSVDREAEVKALKIKPKKFNVLYLGGDNPIKGWNFMKELIKKQLPDIQFLIGGKCEEHITEGNAVYIGVQKQLCACMSCTDVLIFPVASPHQGRPIFEAGAYKIPVIVPDYQVFDETVIDNKNGLRYIPFNVEDCLEKIEFLKEHPTELRKMGEENYKMTLKNHSFDNNRMRMLSILNTL